MRLTFINHSILVISTSILWIIVSQPTKAGDITYLEGSFSFMGNSDYLKKDPKCKAEPGSPHMVTINAEFSIQKDPFNAMLSSIKFTWAGSDCKDANAEYSNYQGSGMPWMSKEIFLTNKTKLNLQTWEVEIIDFSGDLEDEYGEKSSGYFDFKTGTGKTETFLGTTKVDTTTIFKITDFKSKKVTVPEPTSTLSILALGTLGAASTLKRKLKQKQSKSVEKL
jgi:hypothetical protein